jgi:hypothetical protein
MYLLYEKTKSPVEIQKIENYKIFSDKSLKIKKICLGGDKDDNFFEIFLTGNF